MRFVDQEIELWEHAGHLHLPGLFPPVVRERLRHWMAEIELGRGDLELPRAPLPAAPGAGATPHTVAAEDFAPRHQGLSRLLTQGVLPLLAGQLLGEQAVLLHEELIVHHPGDEGEAAHVLAASDSLPRRQITCLLALDPAAPDSGEVEVAGGQQHADLQPGRDGALPRPVEATLEWHRVDLEEGDLLWLHPSTPLRRGANKSGQPRREVRLTFGAVSEGSLRGPRPSSGVRSKAS